MKTIFAWLAAGALAHTTLGTVAATELTPLADLLTSSLEAARQAPDDAREIKRLEYLCGLGKDLSPEEFSRLRPMITEFAQLGVVAAMVLLADRTLAAEPATAFNWYSAAAQTGHVRAVTQLGLMLSTFTVPGTPDADKALHCFQYASDHGDLEAEGALAEHNLRGLVTPKDPFAALALLREASEGGDSKAMNRLGDLLVTMGNEDVKKQGENSRAYFEEAVRWFTKSSEDGNLNALGNLGVLYMNGQGVPPDSKKAAGLFQQGAMAGNPFCMVLHAQCLDSGIALPRNSLMAQTWYRRAAEQGDKRAIVWCLNHNVTFTRRAAE